MILRVGVLKRADGADAHAVEVGAGFGGVALKIAMQRALLLGDGEFIAGFGEMVHADVVVAGVEKLHQAGAEDFGIFPCPRARCVAKAPCCFLSQGTWA